MSELNSTITHCLFISIKFCCVVSVYKLRTSNYWLSHYFETTTTTKKHQKNSKLFLRIYSISHIFLLWLSSTHWPLSQSLFKLVVANHFLRFFFSVWCNWMDYCYFCSLSLILSPFRCTFMICYCCCCLFHHFSIRVCVCVSFTWVFHFWNTFNGAWQKTLHSTIYTEMSIDSHTLSSTLCTAAMHIESHSIHYTAMKQAGKQAGKQTQNTTKLDSTRFDVNLLFDVLRENAVYSGEECVACTMRLSFFPPFFFLSTTSHSTV